MAAGGAAAFFATGVVGHLGLDLLGIGAAVAWLAAAIGGFLLLARAHDSELIAALGGPAAGLGAVLVASSADVSDAVLLAVGIGWTAALAFAAAGQRWFIARAVGGVVGATVILFGVGLSVDDSVTALSLAGGVLGVASIVVLGVQQLREFDPEALPALVEARIAAGVLPWTAAIVALLVGVEFGETAAGWAMVGLGVAAGLLIHLTNPRGSDPWSALGVRAPRAAIHPTMAMLHQLAAIGTSLLGFLVVVDGPALLGVLLAQTVVTGALAARTRAPEMATAASLLGGIVIVWSVLLTGAALAGTGFTIGELLATGAVLLVAFVGGWLLRTSDTGGGAWILVWCAALVWVVAAWSAVPQAQMWVSLTWAAMAVLLLASRTAWTGAAAFQLRTAVHIGLATLALTGGKLIFVDLVAVDVLWRAGLFLAIGGVFLRLAFVLPDLLGRIDESAEEPALEPAG